MKKRFKKTELDVYKEQLFNLKDDVSNQIKDTSQETLMKSPKDISGDISGHTLHIADVATDSYERDFNLGLVSAERETLLEIEEALERVEDKIYGNCQMCKKPIAKIRLKAIPYAKYCKKCQEETEKQTRHI
ncbi:MAG: TraR/DksA family transcriptional regulator [Candidatus Omnitrophica bacterium]|nr:TraR/DksA family transcriptional regulator [Candidatus Omnitrophota bacterium]MBU0878905.1 TraR/DksA family transcriptional regulator [Candidatus Omnitrophota bacterium]MBU0896145.1 TraR/DksA family transcriptional regulator [Candidatus Omnitrophota bacterium]MBU1133857.1 TraR/DksA family transcriptional regulator [Candidatus Omnitrophota bacterium]MBU1366759.1 TraR/DksA family transcriptional regulator [Candidatus Omnitrophota bacterium]